MLFLPEIPGRFRVGAITFVTPVRPARVIGSGRLRKSGIISPEPALYLEEVAFTAYYPADVNPGRVLPKGLDWVIRPLSDSLRGFANFTTFPQWVLWPILYFFGSLVRVPVYPNAPLLQPTSINREIGAETLDQWPLVIFSHGLGGSRTGYSQLCSRMAASGKVVLAVEHRDGTGVICMPRSWQSDGKAKTRSIPYYRDDDVVWETAPESSTIRPLPLRTEQLAFRHHELHIVHQTFSGLVQGDPSLELETIDSVEIDKQGWSLVNSRSGKGPVSYDEDITLAGHSFGGCTVLSVISNPPPTEYAPIPVTKALVLDPWLEPLPLSGLSPISYSQGSSKVELAVPSFDTTVVDGKNHELPRILVLNSEAFTLWKDHYTRLREVINAWEPQDGRILTLVASQHVSFSDFQLIPFLQKKGAQTFMDIICQLSIGFLDGKLESILETISTRRMEIEIIGKRKDGRPKRKLVGSVGDVIVD